MNGKQLSQLIRKDEASTQQYGGILCSNRLPMHRFKKPRFFIVNTDPHNKPGKHWVAFYFPKKGSAEFFDSFGNPPSRLHRNFTKFLKRHNKKYMYNKKRLQGTGSKTCGPYALYYVMHRSHHVPMDKIVSKFSKDNLKENDRHINEWIQKMYAL